MKIACRHSVGVVTRLVFLRLAFQGPVGFCLFASAPSATSCPLSPTVLTVLTALWGRFSHGCYPNCPGSQPPLRPKAISIPSVKGKARLCSESTRKIEEEGVCSTL